MDVPLPSTAALAAYDLAPPISIARFPRQGVNNELLLVHTGEGALVLKIYRGAHRAASLDYEHRLLARLACAGLPFAVPAPLATRDGATRVRLGRRWATLAPYVAAVPFDASDLDHAALLGAALAMLHTSLVAIPPRPRPGRPLFAALFGYPPSRYSPLALAPAHLGLAHDPHADELLAWWRAEAAALSAFVDGPYRALPHQLCHNDPAPANVLVAEGRVAALLDFEYACPAPRALDLAMALRMTMRVWENPDPWPAARAVLAAYLAGAPLTGAEARSIPALIRLRSAIPVLWRLGRMERPEDAQAVLRGITFLRNATTWLDQHGTRLAELAVALSRAGAHSGQPLAGI
jgi:homoserine kinase type II